MSLLLLAAKAAKVPATAKRMTVGKTRFVNIPQPEYRRYVMNTMPNKKIIRKVKRKLARETGSPLHAFKGRFNINAPGVYKNKNWRFVANQNNTAVFANTKNGPLFFIHPVTGKRRIYSGNENKIRERFEKRSRYNHWTKFVKRGKRFLTLPKEKLKRGHNMKILAYNIKENKFKTSQPVNKTKLHLRNPNRTRITHVITADPERRVINVKRVRYGQNLRNAKNVAKFSMNSNKNHPIMKKLRRLWNRYGRTGWKN